MNFTLRDLCNETELSFYIVVEFLNSNGLNITLDDDCPDLEVPEEVYHLVCSKTNELRPLHNLREFELKTKINFLQQRIAHFEKKKRLGIPHLVYTNELLKAEAELKLRSDLDAANCKPDYDAEFYEDNYEPEDESTEYKIYNSYGYVTHAVGLSDAQAKVDNFGGEAIDKNGKCVYKSKGYISNRLDPWD